MLTAKIVSLVAKTVLIALPLVAIAPSVSANPKMASKLKLLPTTTNQRQTSALNPHPSIFAQAPYNRSQIMLGDLRLAKQVQKPANSDAENKPPSQSEVKPWSESQENRKALVKAINGQFNIRLRNLTNTEVTYELVGHTNQR